MSIDRETLPAMLRAAVATGHAQSGVNSNFLIPAFFEFLAFQVYQLAPMEFEEWFPLILQQCKDPNNRMPELVDARYDLSLTLEMIISTHP